MYKTIPFSRYALLLGTLTVALYSVFAVLSYYQYQQAREALQVSDVQGAHDELDDAVYRAIGDLREGAAQVAAWDELFQQLSNPAYFVYWHAHRITGSGALDRRFDDLKLYDTQGKALSELKGSSLPFQIEPGEAKEKYVDSTQGVLVHFFLPLRVSQDEPVRGYLGLSAKLLPAVQRLHIFRLMDSSTLRFRPQGEMNSVGDILAAAQFQLLPTRRFALIDSLVGDVLLTMGVLVMLPSLILIVTFTRFAGRAVRRVPEVVRRLRESDRDGPITLDELLHDDRRSMQITELHTAEQFVVEYHNELSSANAVLDEKNRELWAMAHHDSLTGARNRRAFDDYLDTLQDIGGQRRQAFELRLMLCDVNHFKAINDSYGHQVGDAVLNAVAECLRSALRAHEMLFRLGGDEFACFLLDCDAVQAVAVAKRCEQEVRNYPYSELGLSEPVRLSIGISDAIGDDHISAKDLLREADMAMYSSKRPGSSSITVYEPSMAGNTSGIFSSSANEAVYRAIEHGEGLCMHYQPIRSLSEQKQCYYEALLRLEHGGRLIHPAEAFSVVESRHLELDLDRAVLRQVCADLRAGIIPAGTGVSVNLSGPSVIHDEVLEWLAPLGAFMEQYRLVIEVTETSLITQMDAARDNLAQMRRLGFMVALDDFGSGYSSLRYLTSMPVDIVKFDISLIHALKNPAQRRLVENLVDLIKDSGQAVVAEGIETEEMLQTVTEVGFGSVQGYLIGRPARLSGPETPDSSGDPGGQAVASS